MGLITLLDRLLSKSYRPAYIRNHIKKKNVSGLVYFLTVVEPGIDPDSKLRTQATNGLASIVQHNQQAIRDIFVKFDPNIMIGRDSREYYAKAVEVLAGIGEPVVPALIAALKDDNQFVRQYAPQVLGQYAADAIVRIGPDASPAMIEALKNTSVRDYTISTLSSMGPEIVPTLIAALKDTNVGIRLCAAETVCIMGRLKPDIVRQKPEAVPVLIEALKDKDAGVRQSVAEVLGTIGPEAKEAGTALIAVLKDKNEGVREKAAEALGTIGPEAKETVPALLEALKDTNRSVRHTAAETLGAIGLENKETVPALIAVFKDKYKSVPQSVIEALAKSGDIRALTFLLEFLFSRAQTLVELRTLLEPLLSMAPKSAVSKAVMEDAVWASSYDFYNEIDEHNILSLRESNVAIDRLCETKSPVTSNLLHLVCNKKSIYVKGFIDERIYVDFKWQRETASRELERRGSPAYDPTAFLK